MVDRNIQLHKELTKGDIKLLEKSKNTIVTFILDESGSMMAVRDETISGFNEYVQTLQVDKTPTLIKLLSFNSINFSTLYDFDDIQTVEPMDRRMYSPSSGTPLYDAIVRGMMATENFLEISGKQANVMFTIMTDGMENSSRYFTFSDVAEMVEQKEKEGWIFTFLGANQNAWREGRKFGIKGKYASNYRSSNPKEAFRVMAESTARARTNWRGTREAADFYTDDEKRRLLE